jgi:hypothetical protein
MCAYHGHAHLPAKLGVISDVQNNTIFNGGCPGMKVPSESTLFLDILEMASTFFMTLYDQFKSPCRVVLVFNKFYFQKILGFSPTRQWHLSCRVPVGPAQAFMDLEKIMNFKNRSSRI